MSAVRREYLDRLDSLDQLDSLGRLRADDSVVQLKKLPEAPRSLIRPPNPSGQTEYVSAVNVVERAVETLDELFRRNEDLEAAATRYKSDALAAQAQVRQLLSEIDSIKKDRESRVAYAKDRISKLEAEVEALRYELGSANENLNESNQNLANFSSQITKLLHDAPQKLMEINQRN